MAQPRRAEIRGLVRRLRGGRAAEQADAAFALFNMCATDGPPGASDAIAAELSAAGGLPDLLRLAGHLDRLGVAACGLLQSLTSDSPSRWQAIVAAGGAALLVRCLQNSSLEIVQKMAAGALNNISRSGGLAAVVAAGAVPAAFGRLRSSSDADVLERTSGVLRNLSTSLDGRDAIADAGGVPPLVSLLRRPDPAAMARAAASVLVNLTNSAYCLSLILVAGGIPALVELLATRTGDAGTVEAVLKCFNNLLSLSPADAAGEMMEAGVVPALARCIKGQRLSDDACGWAARCLRLLARRGTQPAVQGDCGSRGSQRPCGGAHAALQP